MKKIILLLSIVALTIVSCSKSDSPAVVESATLPKRIEYISNSPDGNNTIFLTYNGNKLAETTSTRNGVVSKSVYTYNGDLIIKRDQYDGTVLKGTDDFIYSNNNLITVLSTSNGTLNGAPVVNKSKIEYTYLAGGKIKEQSYDFDAGVYVAENNSNEYTYVNGNCTQYIQKYSSSFPNGSGTTQTNTSENTYVFEYDNKISPIRNIVGLSKIVFDEDFSANNVIKRTSSRTSTTNNVPDQVFPATIRTFVLSYNGNDYLSESKYDFQFYLNTNPATYETRTNFTKYFYE